MVKSQLGKFWSQDYKKEKVEELREIVEQMKKADTTELVSLVPKAIYLLIKLYDWATGGKQDDYKLLADLVTEVAKGHLELDRDEIENFIEELEVKLK